MASIPCPEVRLRRLVGQCDEWMRTHLPFRPVRYDLPGPGPMELKVDLPEVSKGHGSYDRILFEYLFSVVLACIHCGRVDCSERHEVSGEQLQ